jgi:phosphoglycerate dehydrogenase-like enzyme
MRVHIKRELDDEQLEILEDRLVPEVELTFGAEPPNPADYRILVAGRPGRELIEAGRCLDVLIIPWAGIPVSTRALMAEFPQIAVHNLHHNAASTAELALTLMFAAAKSLVPMDQALRRGDWHYRTQMEMSLLLESKTALILGYGEIGQRVGRVLDALGMRVLAIRRNPGTGDAGIPVHPPDALHDLLPQADVLFLTLPLTEQTRGLIGAAELELLPQGAILVNVGRGPIVDQGALYHALESGKLHGAGLDVWYNYPPDEESKSDTPPADFPFHQLNNVVMSPHRGGHTEETGYLRMIHLAESLNAAARGEPIPNAVDLQAGY